MVPENEHFAADADTPASCRLGILCLSPSDALIDSEKSFLPKAKPSKINILDSCFFGNDDFFSVSLVASHDDMKQMTGS